MTVLIVGNSVSMRPHPEVPAYPELLGRCLGPSWALREVIRGGETIEQLEAPVLGEIAAAPDIVVLQVGINECAPRPLSVRERERLGRLRPGRLRALVIKAIHHLRPRIIRARALQQVTPLPRFLSSMRRVATAAVAHGAHVLVLPITTVTAVAEARTPFTNREVARYNSGLATLAAPGVTIVTAAEIFGTQTADVLCMTPDTVHLSASAHEQLSAFVCGWIQHATRKRVS